MRQDTKGTTSPLPVIMHFPGPYASGESRQYQLSQHLGSKRRVIWVADGDGGPRRDTWPLLSFTAGLREGQVEVLHRSRSVTFDRLTRRAPAVAAWITRRELGTALDRMAVGPRWLYTIGAYQEWSMASKHQLTAVEICDPPFTGDPNASWLTASRIAKDADLVVTTARALEEELLARGVSSERLPNAVTADLIERARVDPGGSPNALYMGTIDWRFDAVLVTDLARLLPQVTFTLAGRLLSPEDERLAELASLPNVNLLGVVSEERKVDLLTRCHVGFVPFLPGDMADGVNPTKVYEYSAYGLPVVATATKACRDIAPPVRIARDAGEFAKEISAALADGARRPASFDFAEHNTWEQRATRLDALLALRESQAPARPRRAGR